MKRNGKKEILTADDGYWFGIGAFETIAVWNRVPIFLEEHLDRLWRAVTVLELKQEKERELFFSECRRMVDVYRREHVQKDYALKLTVSPGNLLLTSRENPYLQKPYQQGAVLAVSSIRNNETSPLTFIKSLCCADHIREKRRMNQMGIDEPLFLNTKGEVCEGATSNLFVVKNGSLVTPSASCGLLKGILRNFVFRHFEVREEVIGMTDLMEAEECFLTNSLMGVMPVRSVDSQIVRTGKVTETVRKTYEAWLENHSRKEKWDLQG